MSISQRANLFGLRTLSLSGFVRQKSSLDCKIAGCESAPTYFEDSKSYLIVNYLSGMKKSWCTACFKLRSDEEEILQCEGLSTELAGPSQYLYLNVHNLLNVFAIYIDQNFELYWQQPAIGKQAILFPLRN